MKETWVPMVVRIVPCGSLGLHVSAGPSHQSGKAQDLDLFPTFRQGFSETRNVETPQYMGVSKNRGTPKSSILIGVSIINHPFWGTHLLEIAVPIVESIFFPDCCQSTK